MTRPASHEDGEFSRGTRGEEEEDGGVEFDRNGDIVGPFRLWRIQNGEVTTVGEISDRLRVAWGEHRELLTV